MFVIFFFLFSLAWNYFDEVFKQAAGFFAYVVVMLKIVFAYIIFTLLLTYVGSFVCSILSQKIFDELNSVRKRKYIRNPNLFFSPNHLKIFAKGIISMTRK